MHMTNISKHRSLQKPFPFLYSPLGEIGRMVRKDSFRDSKSVNASKIGNRIHIKNAHS